MWYFWFVGFGFLLLLLFPPAVAVFTMMSALPIVAVGDVVYAEYAKRRLT